MAKLCLEGTIEEDVFGYGEFVYGLLLRPRKDGHAKLAGNIWSCAWSCVAWTADAYDGGRAQEALLVAVALLSNARVAAGDGDKEVVLAERRARRVSICMQAASPRRAMALTTTLATSVPADEASLRMNFCNTRWTAS